MFFSPTEELCFKVNAFGRTFHHGKSIGKDGNSSVISVVSFPIDFPGWKVLPKAFTLKQSSSAKEKDIMSRDLSGRPKWPCQQAQNSNAIDHFFPGANSSAISVVT